MDVYHSIGGCVRVVFQLISVGEKMQNLSYIKYTELIKFCVVCCVNRKNNIYYD